MKAFEAPKIPANAIGSTAPPDAITPKIAAATPVAAAVAALASSHDSSPS